MTKKAEKELEEWDEKSKRNRKMKESEGPKLTMSVLMQSRASFSTGKAVGIDGISAEILKTIPWRALQKIRRVFELRYVGLNKEEIQSWLEKYHCPDSQQEDDQVEGTNKRYLHPERIGQVVWRMPLHSARDGTERTGEKGQKLGGHPHLLL